MSEAREQLLRLVRNAEQPSAAAEERLLRALHEAVDAGKVSAVSERVNAALDAPSSQWALPAAKLLAPLASVLTLAIVAAVVFLSRDPPSTPPRKSVNAPVEGAAPSPSPRPSAREATQQPAPSPAPAPDAGDDSAAKGAATPGFSKRASSQREKPSAATLDQATELALLQRVQTALRRRDGATALSELDAYEHAAGQLRAERQAARILALCLLDRSAEAQQVAAEFEREHPDSPQRAAIAGSCANSKRNGAP